MSKSKREESNITFAGIPVARLQQLQDMFARAQDVACIIVDIDGYLITRPSNFTTVCRMVQSTEKGKESCDLSDLERSRRARESDGPVYHMCQSCGFLDGSVPIAINGQRVGYWLAGQVNALGVEREDIALHAQVIGADVTAMLSAYDHIRPVTVARFEQILESLQQLVDRTIR